MDNNKKFGLIAVNDEETVCSLCGKNELNRVMWIIELDSDGSQISDAEPFGTTCGARLLKITASKVSTKINNFESKVNSKRSELKNKKAHELGNDEIINKWNEKGLNFVERRATPEWSEMIKNNRTASSWANEQQIIMELS